MHRSPEASSAHRQAQRSIRRDTYDFRSCKYIRRPALLRSAGHCRQRSSGQPECLPGARHTRQTFNPTRIATVRSCDRAKKPPGYACFHQDNTHLTQHLKLDAVDVNDAEKSGNCPGPVGRQHEHTSRTPINQTSIPGFRVGKPGSRRPLDHASNCSCPAVNGSPPLNRTSQRNDIDTPSVDSDRGAKGRQGKRTLAAAQYTLEPGTGPVLPHMKGADLNNAPTGCTSGPCHSPRFFLTIGPDSCGATTALPPPNPLYLKHGRDSSLDDSPQTETQAAIQAALSFSRRKPDVPVGSSNRFTLWACS